MQKLSNDKQYVLKALGDHSHKYVAPLYWGDAHSILHSASCFFIRIGDFYFGVTAQHVFQQLQEDVNQYESLDIRISNFLISNLVERKIDIDKKLDIATFSLNAEEITQIGKCCFEHENENEWPPKPPEIGKGVVSVGYPGVDRKIIYSKNVEFTSVCNILVAASFSDDKLSIIVEEHNLNPFKNRECMPLTKDLGGFSGSPIITNNQSDKPHLFYRLGGVFTQGKEMYSTYQIKAARIDLIQSDGRIRKNFIDTL